MSLQLVLEGLQTYRIAGAVNPRDNDLKITQDGDRLVFNGFKNFNTGGVISDLTVLEGVLEGTDKHIFTLVKTSQPGIQFEYNWDAIGMRLTESGSVRISNVCVPWSDALGWNPKAKQPNPAILEVPFGSMLLPTIQLVFSNFYIGIAQGALEAGQEYTRMRTRAWPYGGDDKEKATEEWYILERYGGFRAHLDAADALADRAGEVIADVYRDAGVGVGASRQENDALTNGHMNGSSHTQGRSSVTAERRGNVAATVATVKVVATDTALSVTSGVFEMLGASATSRKAGFDRFWRNIRTHTLHDPVAYKRREVGRWTLLNEVRFLTCSICRNFNGVNDCADSSANLVHIGNDTLKCRSQSISMQSNTVPKRTRRLEVQIILIWGLTPRMQGFKERWSLKSSMFSGRLVGLQQLSFT